MPKTHYLDPDSQDEGPACGQQPWRKLDSNPVSVSCKNCLQWLDDRNIAYKEVHRAAAKLAEWQSLVELDGKLGSHALLFALKHTINCDGDINDPFALFFGHMPCPFCQGIHDAYGIPRR